ncbi:LacI family DNA-binding transcriptional regulator, partial [Streptomyces ipomoeae]|uniref:LacI family DNA-binding transcriptional regulator n=1 Tax=Streptomyces ipomoeae TaxID=103232 RepID=UPI0029BDDD84
MEQAEVNRAGGGRTRGRAARPRQGASMGDVARLAGVSSQTVSRVSNGFAGVSEETRR